MADPTAEFTKALELGFDDAAALFGGTRSKRYALKVKDGKVAAAFVEPDNTGTAGELPPYSGYASTFPFPNTGVWRRGF